MLFGALGIFLEYAKIIGLGRNFLDLSNTLVGFFYYMDMEHLRHYGFILWFLLALFWAKCFARILVHVIHSTFLRLLIAAAILWLSFHFMGQMPWGIKGGLLGCCWVVFGYSYGLYWNGRHRSFRWIAISVGSVFLATAQIPVLDLAAYALQSPLYNLLYSLVIILLLLSCFEFMKEYIGDLWWARMLAKYSIYVMALHVYTNNVADWIVNRNLYGLWQGKFAVSILLLSIILYLLNKKSAKEYSNG